MTQTTNTAAALTEAELQQLRDKLPLLLKVVGILEAEVAVIDDGITVDDRSDFLELLLPHFANRLDKDMPRLRQTLEMLDAFAENINEALTAEGKTRSETAAAIQKELSAGDQAVLHALGEAVQELNNSLEREIEQEAATRFATDQALEAALDAEKAEREQAAQTHDEDPSAHDALVRRITVGDISPVIGVCWLETGNCTGLWYNCDAEGQPVTPNKRYFDHHPVYSAMKRVLVDGQVMVENAPFWIKTMKPETGPFAGKLCKIISPGPADGFHPYPAFLSPSGDVLEKMYIGAYQGTGEANNMVGSRPGKVPLVSLDFPTMQTRCTNRNTGGVEGFRMWDFYQYSALCLLFLIEHCTTESQSIMGRGYVDASGATYTDDYRNTEWRGYVGLYGNVWQMCDGFRIATNGQIEMFKNDGSRAWVNTGKTCPAYNGSAAQYAITTFDGEGAGFNFDDVFVPATQGDYTAGTFPDYFYGRNGSAGNVLYVGGQWNYASGAGLFCWYLYSPASHSATSIGCRLAKG
ncbi:hypothetical protein [Oleidesulfovibrio sp.]|uniref:hypothetical protein n=1 Tax=Oleidesulfovibrio sp. TaxID=2909707 RepID=UPI003A86D6FD